MALLAGAWAALLALGARAEAPAPAPPDLDAEIAWARANWPASFEGVHFRTQLAKLRAWVARGPAPVYVFNDDFACRAATLFPNEEQRDDGAEAQPMTAKIVGRSHVDGGRTVREVKYVTVDFELSSEDGSGTEARDEDGRWHLTSSHGYGIPTIYGEQGHVESGGLMSYGANLPDLFRRNLAATVVTGWLVWGLFWVQLNLMWMSIYARRVLPWTWPVIQNYGMGVVAWALITPLMLASARRNSLVDGRRWWRAALHLGLACCFALLHIALWQTLVRSQRPFWGQGYVETMLWTVMLYAVLLALSSYHEFADWLRERKTATARLRAEIAEAELTSSAMRFDPENVLARLDVLADIVQRDAPTAERALTQLAQRLRVSLDTAHAGPRTLEAWATKASA